MKKIMMLLIVAVLMLGMSGNAMAFFGEGDLIRVVYSTINGTGNEFATDLGSLSTLLSSPGNITTGAFSVLPGQTDFSNTRVAYFVYDFSGTNGHMWSSGPQNPLGVTAGSFANAQGGMYTAASLWATSGTNTFSNTQANPSSYWINVNESGSALGTFDNYLKSSAEANLTALNTPGGFVDQYLYYYGADPLNSPTITQVAMIQTNANGTTTLSTVPIPAAAYLFGSGLLGMFGLRRKMAA
ncbi:MAG TPA: hypothetical protein VL087_00925 [Nitrospirota bacterium]|nr:hypothetical protein [Nitrospirota bacterium]